MNFIKNYLSLFSKTCNSFNLPKLNNLVNEISKIKKNNGRIFFLGV